jgi:hypothetical protein
MRRRALENLGIEAVYHFKCLYFGQIKILEGSGYILLHVVFAFNCFDRIKDGCKITLEIQVCYNYLS